ncbi:protoporphyrinogen/coproporphyrinogen oxidase [Hydrogenophaga sp. OTU3427]|uniref:protoporphyrinogen/coproporphyrinogen oxidase n=1 Tax=Hydrogenophaga sp. OTU3427 TaxID=3043856 RepID=UPI00313CDE59
MSAARRVIVIGAGLAGLTTAHRLVQQGFEVLVLEGQDQVGGRMGQRRSGPIPYNTGARLIYPFGQALHRLIDELGLRGELVPLKGLSATCVDTTQRHTIQLMPGAAVLRTPGLSLGTRARLVGSALRLWGLRRRVDPDHAASALIGPGDESLAEHVRRTLGEDALRLLVEPVFRATRSWNPEDLSAAFYLSTTPHLIGQDTTYSLRQGMGQLTGALAQRLPVRLNARAIAVRLGRDGMPCEVDAVIDGRPERLPADLVVCATEGALAAPLLTQASPEHRALLGAVRYNSLGVVHCALQGELPRAMEFATRRRATRIATWQQTPASGTQPALLYCQLTPEAAREAQTAGLTGQLDRLIGDEVRARVPDFESRLIHRHNQWIAHKLPSFYPGYLARVRDFLAWQASRPQRLYLCGDYLSQALLNGACASGQDTADLIARHWR